MGNDSGSGQVGRKAGKIIKSSDDRFFGPQDQEERKNSEVRRKDTAPGFSFDAYRKLFGYTREPQAREIAEEYAKKYISEKDSFNEKTSDIKKHTNEELDKFDRRLERIGKRVFGIFEKINVSRAQSGNNTLSPTDILRMQHQVSLCQQELDQMIPDIVEMKGYRSQEKILKKAGDEFAKSKFMREHVRNMFKVVSLGVIACRKYLEGMNEGESRAQDTEAGTSK